MNDLIQNDKLALLNSHSSQQIEPSLETFNRISFAKSRFTIHTGQLEEVLKVESLTIVISGIQKNNYRVYYNEAFNPNNKSVRPVCWANNGISPDLDVTEQQSQLCTKCKHNIRAPHALGKACSTKRRLVVLIDGKAGPKQFYTMDIGGKSLFGINMNPKHYNFSNYAAWLSSKGIAPASIKTEISFTDDSVPVLQFSPHSKNNKIEYTEEDDIDFIIAHLNSPILNENLQRPIKFSKNESQGFGFSEIDDMIPF